MNISTTDNCKSDQVLLKSRGVSLPRFPRFPRINLLYGTCAAPFKQGTGFIEDSRRGLIP